MIACTLSAASVSYRITDSLQVRLYKEPGLMEVAQVPPP